MRTLPKTTELNTTVFYFKHSKKKLLNVSAESPSSGEVRIKYLMEVVIKLSLNSPVKNVITASVRHNIHLLKCVMDFSDVWYQIAALKGQIDSNFNLRDSVETEIIFVSALLRYGLSHSSWQIIWIVCVAKWNWKHLFQYGVQVSIWLGLSAHCVVVQ